MTKQINIFAICDAVTGQLKYTGVYSGVPLVMENEIAHIIPEQPEDSMAPLYWDGSKVVAAQVQPSVHHKFDWKAKKWTDSRKPAQRKLDDAADLKNAKAAKIMHLNAVFESETGTVEASYPLTERLTWAQQEAEAQAHLVDSSTPTPFLLAVATSRGISVIELRDKILSKAEEHRLRTANNLGILQRCKTQVDAAKTIPEVLAINWTST